MKLEFSKFSPRRTAVLALASAVLVGCGGVDYLSTSGVVAEGPALAGAKVTAVCASGSQPTASVSGSNGSYVVNIVGGVAPCVLTAETSTGAKYRAFTAGSSSTLAVNVTPVSNLVYEVLKSEFGATSESGFVSNAAVKAALTGSATSVASAIKTAIATSLAKDPANPVFVALNGFTALQLESLLVGTFKPSVAGSGGDAVDTQLAAVTAKLESAGVIDSATGAFSASAVAAIVAAIDVPIAGSSGASGGTGATGGN